MALFPFESNKMQIKDLVAELNCRVRKEIEDGGETFLGFPDRWYEPPGPKFRCVNNHVSMRVLKSEAAGCDLCLACHGRLTLTFPEDEDGLLV